LLLTPILGAEEEVRLFPMQQHHHALEAQAGKALLLFVTRTPIQQRQQQPEAQQSL
jgi:hypothetical protein